MGEFTRTKNKIGTILVVILLISLYAVMAEKIIGAGVFLSPFRWEEGKIGVLKDCTVRRLNPAGTWVNGVWSPDNSAISTETMIYTGNGQENNPYRIPNAVKGLVCYPPYFNFKGLPACQSLYESTSYGSCQHNNRLYWFDSVLNQAYIYPSLVDPDPSLAGDVKPDLNRKYPYPPNLENYQQGAVEVIDTFGQPIVFVMYYDTNEGKWKYESPTSTVNPPGGTVATTETAGAPLTAQYIDFPYGYIQQYLGPNPGFDGGGIYFPENINPKEKDFFVLFLFTGRRDTELAGKIDGETMPSNDNLLQPAYVNKHRYYFGSDGNDVQHFDKIINEHVKKGGRPVILVELLDANLEKPYADIPSAQYGKLLSLVESILESKGIKKYKDLPLGVKEKTIHYSFLTFSYSSGPESKVIEKMSQLLAPDYFGVAIGESTFNEGDLPAVIETNKVYIDRLVFVWSKGNNFQNDINFHDYIANKQNMVSIQKSVSHQQIPAELFKEFLTYYFSAVAPAPASSTSGTAAGQVDPAAPPSTAPETNPLARQIDEVWKTIREWLGFPPSSDQATKVWHFGWVTWESLYAPSSISPVSVAAGKGPCYSKALSLTESEAKSKLEQVSFQGRNIAVHKIIAPLVKKIEAEITGARVNYQFASVGTFNWRCINSPLVPIVEPNNCKDAEGESHRSSHSYGLAIDINSQQNPFCVVGEDGKMYTSSAKTAECSKQKNGQYYDIPQTVVDIFRANDFNWGGDWSKGKDYMHFEWKGNQGDFDEDGTDEPCQSSMTSGTDTYNPFIEEAANNVGVTGKAASLSVNGNALIKALIQAESGFNPNLGSGTNCQGLMQVCSWQDVFTEATGKLSSFNLENNPLNPRSNIYLGSYVLLKKMEAVDGCNTGADTVKCIIAAYNAGEGLINAAVAATGTSNPPWKQVYEKITPELMKGHGYTDKKGWHDDQQVDPAKYRLGKKERLGPYVEGVFASYQQYQGDFRV